MTRPTGRGRSSSSSKARAWSKLVLEKLDIPAGLAAPTLRARRRARSRPRRRPRRASPPERRSWRRRRPGGRGPVGTGAVRPGVVSLTLGTSASSSRTTEAPLVEPREAARLLPRRARPLALHGRHSVRGGQPPVVPRHPRPKESFADLVTEAGGAGGSEGSSSCPTSRREDALPGSARPRQLRRPHPGHGRAHLTRPSSRRRLLMRDCFALLRGAAWAEVKEVRIAGAGPRRPLAAGSWGASSAAHGDRSTARRERLRRGARSRRGRGAWPTVEAACDATIAVTGRDVPAPSGRRPTRPSTPGTAAVPALKPTTTPCRAEPLSGRRRRGWTGLCGWPPRRPGHPRRTPGA